MDTEVAFIWQISIVQFDDKSIINGILLSGKLKQKKKALTLFNIPSTYFQEPFANRLINIQYGLNNLETITDQYGGFYVESNNIGSDKIKVLSNNEELKVVQSYPMVFQNSDNPLAVISDIDDTLMVSYTASTWNRIRTILFTSPENRKSVGFTREILNAVSNIRGRIFYVSKSESNLFNLLTSVIQKQKLPIGNLTLTPYLRYHQLLKPKKGKDFKEWSIRKIIDNSPHLKFILIGDDTQQDMLVYAKIAKLFPDNIVKIYIRKTRKQLLGNKLNYINKLKETGIPFLYFTDQDPVEKEIISIEKLIN